MKRCRLGGVLLLALLIAGLLLTHEMGTFHRELGESMARAASQNREDAQPAVEQTREHWDSRRWLSAMLYDHTPMEEIEEHFALLTPDAEDEDFRETCMRLAARLKALGDSQLLTWANLF